MIVFAVVLSAILVSLALSAVAMALQNVAEAITFQKEP